MGEGPDTVVLVHGLGRTHGSMVPLALALRWQGYRVLNWRYPSTRGTIAEHAERLDREHGESLRREPGRVHFVTHSMGGLVVRQWLGTCPMPNAGCVVMLAPPNQGSEVADQLRDWWIFRRATGPAGAQLTTGPEGPTSLPEPPVPVGVIAGSRAVNPLFSRWIGAPNDGKVAVARTHLPGMADHLVLPLGHTFLPWHPSVIRQVLSFLRSGAFQRARPSRTGVGGG